MLEVVHEASHRVASRAPLGSPITLLGQHPLDLSVQIRKLFARPFVQWRRLAQVLLQFLE